MTVTMESCPSIISEITSAIDKLVHDYESLVDVIDNNDKLSINDSDDAVIDPKLLIEYDDLCKTADRIQSDIVELSTDKFFDIEIRNVSVSDRAKIKFYSMQVDALQGMLDMATNSMASTDIDYFSRENMMPYIRYYKRMSSKVGDMASEDMSASDKSKLDEDASLKYIKTRSERSFNRKYETFFNKMPHNYE